MALVHFDLVGMKLQRGQNGLARKGYYHGEVFTAAASSGIEFYRK